jgi:hypothetical protein
MNFQIREAATNLSVFDFDPVEAALTIRSNLIRHFAAPIPSRSELGHIPNSRSRRSGPIARRIWSQLT